MSVTDGTSPTHQRGPFVVRVVRGRPPALWRLAQLQFVLALTSLAGGFSMCVIVACATWGSFGESGGVAGLAALASAFTSALPGAVLLFGASVTRYLAAREHREYAAPMTPGAEEDPQ